MGCPKWQEQLFFAFEADVAQKKPCFFNFVAKNISKSEINEKRLEKSDKTIQFM
jgi:hypothetical protein